MKVRNKPIEIRQGNITVKIYRVRDGSTASKTAFQVADYTSGKRKLHTFANEQEARARAAEIGRQLARGDVDAITLTNKDKADYVRALELVKPSGVPLAVAALHYAEAVKILGADLVIEAAKFYDKRHAKIKENKTVQEVYELLIADAESRKLSARYIEDLEHRAGRFADAFQVPIADVTGDDVREFLAGLSSERRSEDGQKSNRSLSGRSLNNYLGAVTRLFEFAKARKFLPSDFDEVSDIDPVKDKGGDIEIYTVAELARMLAVAESDIIAPLAIGAFAGLRSAEIERLDWSEVNLAERFITVTAGKAKTAARRVVPISDNLAKWLEPVAQREGLVWELGHAYFHQRLRETAEATGGDGKAPVELKANGLRHSFISYRVALTQNVNQVALEAGNSPRMIFQHYRELVTKNQAEAWFNLAPDNRQTVPFPKVA